MTKIATLKANVSNFTSNLNKATQEAEKFKSSMSKASNLGMEGTLNSWKKSGEQIQEVSKDVMKFTGVLTVAAAGMVGYAVSVSSSFEDAFADFRKVTEATAEEFQMIDRELKNLTKRIPATYEEIAGAAAAASRLGVAKEFVVEFAEAAVMMGTATNMGTEDAAESMARFSNIVGTSLGDVHNLGSAIVDLGNNFAASESEIMTMGLRLAAAGKSAGMSEGDILGLAATMTSLGLRAEMGGTAMSQVLNRIGSDLAHNGTEAQAWASRAGMSVSEFKGAFEKDAVGALLALMEGLDDAAASGENLDIMLGELGINNIRQVDTMKRLVSGYDLLVEGQNRGNKAFKDGTALTEEAEMRYATFSSQLQMLKNRFRLITDVIGGAFMGVLGNLIKIITPLVDSFTDWLMKLQETNPEILNLVAKVVLITIAILGLITGLAAVGYAFGFMKTGIANLGIAMTKLTGPLKLLATKFLPIILIVAALGYAFYKLWNTNEEFRDAVIRIWDAIKVAYESTLGWVKTQLEQLAPVFESVGGKISAVLGVISDYLVGAVVATADYIDESGGLIGVLQRLAKPINMILTLFSAILGPLGWVLRLFIELATQTSFLSDVMDLLSGNMSLGDFLNNLVDNLETVITNMLEVISEMFDVGAGIVSKIIDGINTHLPKFLELGLNLVTKLAEVISENLPMIVETFINLLTTISEGIIANLPMIVETAMTILLSLVQTILENLPLIIAVAMELITAIVDTLTELLPELIKTGVEILSALIDGIVEILPDLLDTAITILLDLVELIIENLPMFISAGIEIITALIDGLIEMLPSIVESIMTLLVAVFGTLLDALPTILILGVELIVALIGGLLKMLPKIISTTFVLIGKLIWAIIQMLPKIIGAAVKIVLALIKGIVQMGVKIFNAGKDVVVKVIDGIKSFFSKVKSIGKDLMDNALGGIKDKFNSFKDAGKNVVNSIRDGINGAKDKVKGAIGSVTKNIRNFLPFSPAKEGALRDIMDIKIAESIAESIRRGSKTAVKAMSSMSSDIMDESPTVDIAGQVATSNARVQSAIRHVISDDQIQTEKQPAEITFILGDRNYRVFVEDIMKEAQWIEG